MQTLAVAATLVAQAGSGLDVDVTLGQGLVGGAVGAFLTTLVVGAIAVAVFPERTERLMARVLDDPVNSFAYGLFSVLALFVVAILLVFTVVGIVVALPLVLVAYVVWAVGAAVAYLAVADRLVGHEDGWLKALLVAATINGALAATGVGGLLAVVVGITGFGAVLQPYLD
ncbi:uncharacterized protein HHUB_2628 [Halobacterium hubeiense]|uniref:DUF8173 domain-containing protein n=2 Tax=Halobacterium TaxID=2239 RepID=A0A0U5H261_9EURY|nr:hypothetical protein [Halobacterium hubeiense]CQH57917.1 uncharacterized protein HHUB_2628 [Halobacterium hubeiense]